MNIVSRQNIALLLLFVTITGFVVSFGENVLCAGELPGVHEVATVSAVYGAEQIHCSSCPSVPSPSHTPDDHFCTGDCGCPCQAPLSPSPVVVTHSRSFTRLYNAEPAWYIPEVYLSFFVPPDSSTV